MDKLRLFFSLISGDMYYVQPDEVKNLDKNQIPLVKKPSTSCRKCYGRMYVGFEPNKKYYVPCPSCMRKCIDWNTFKEGDVVIETPKTTNQLEDKNFIKELEMLGRNNQHP